MKQTLNELISLVKTEITRILPVSRDLFVVEYH